jgi:uncharacterized protein YecE (DUF72 family)
VGGKMDGARSCIGTSGWQYAHWRDRFYPSDLPTSAWLEYYAAAFSTVEVNSSFYRLPTHATVERWAKQVPEGFVLTFKASRYLTHIRRLRDCAEPLRRVAEAFAGAGGKLGPVLFQLPPDFPVDVALLEAFVRAMPRTLHPAFEFRHASWFTTEVSQILDASSCALVHADRPGVSPAVPTTGGWAYLRFHQGGRTVPGYARRKLNDYADLIVEAGGAHVYAYFNNDADGAAVRDAQTLLHLLHERSVVEH